MKIAIHYTKKIKHHFSDRWIKYCQEKKIDYKIVNCYSNQLIEDLKDCQALMWHFEHANFTDFQIAIKILQAVNAAGIKTFPNLPSCWHFDDKVAQKYLLEAIGAPLVESVVFYDRKEALNWAKKTNYPQIFKLKGGAGSSNVLMIKNRTKCIKIIRKAFGKGFRQFNRRQMFLDQVKIFWRSRNNTIPLIEAFFKLFISSKYEKYRGREKGYVYFQKFVAGNDYDTRVIVIDHKAFAIVRGVREKDFRASGSGSITYSKESINPKMLKVAFEICEKLNTNCLTFDFIMDDKEVKLVEISYGFATEAYDLCPGYWDSNLKWIDGNFIPQNWMVESLFHD